MLRALAVLLAAATCVLAQATPCADLLTCATVGIDQGLRQMQSSSLYPLLGKRLYLEKREDVQNEPDLTQGNVFQRVGKLLDTHNVKAPITDNLSVKLFKTPQGPFDISLDVASPETNAQGRTFFKRRLQMALLPIMYKLGVMTTLMGVLVVMVAKSLAIGVILLILAVSSAVKHKLYWGGGGHVDAHSGGYSAPTGWAQAPQPGVHLHLHGINKDALTHAAPEYHTTGYSRVGYAGATGPEYAGPYNRAAHLAPSAQTVQ
ncbi:uncharacterized protein LOC132194239 [Neocloeon triangulifer]|uniref:uncharacterized protein LOC132194239 n=1 Tax=Neocloeon triangulifer TaxID=2078957 RepID=UPI00286F283C|nr:uncharacterized protein LOC132194239 [Neocloeon triangulifer]